MTAEDTVASWLPLYHDMGLIACFVTPLISGTPIVEISPFDWVTKPALLLESIDAYRATLCWQPNFAYAVLARAVRDEELIDLDLSSVRAFVNCSEPVMAASHDAFSARFAVGHDRLTACYAMAENVFAVTQSPVGEAPRVDRVCHDTFEREHRAVLSDGGDTIDLVSNGSAIDGVQVRVVADGVTCQERSGGEIEIAGDSIFSGYHGRPDLTEAAFSDQWYLTGDLGYLADGELFVTGRAKDLIIIQGRNFYPTDIETAVGELDEIVSGRVVAFGKTDERTGTESLVVLAESDADEDAWGRLGLEIRKTVAQTFDCTVGAVQILPRRWLIKSTAGKPARADSRQKYEAQFESTSLAPTGR